MARSSLPGASRWRAISKLLFSTSERMGTTSPENVLRNFIELLKSASPQLKLAIALLTPWALLLTAISKYSWLSKWFGTIKTCISDWVYASVSIPSNHPLNRQILTWMVEHGLGRNARTLALTPPGLTMSQYMDIHSTLSTYDAYGRRVPAARDAHKHKDDDPDKKSLLYVPEVGTYTFWWKWHRMTFERKLTMHEEYDSKGRVRSRQALTGTESLVISCTSPFSGVKPIQEFLQHIKAAPAKDRSTTIYRPNVANITWDQGITRPSRNLNAVTLDAKVKDELVKDIETYLSPATRKYYANRGIPYRRGFLFYGNPGCGKTSFTNALAGHFGLNVYMFSLSTTNLNDEILEMLFEQLPSRCIVLLEDIDSAGLKRESMRKKPSKRKPHSRPKIYYNSYGDPVDELDIDDDEARGGVTLSGLLNVLDGIHSKEGMLTIMTSNSPDSLDPALVRPGRIDRKVLFGYCSREVTTKLFRHIFEKAPEELIEGETLAASNAHNIAELAEEFADKIPADKLTPAEVQGFLLMHREDPVAAVSEVAEWAEKTIERKAAGTNVETFASETQAASETAAQEDEDSDKEAHDSAVDLSESPPPAPDPPGPMGMGDENPALSWDTYKACVDIVKAAGRIPPAVALGTTPPPPPPPIPVPRSIPLHVVPPPPPYIGTRTLPPGIPTPPMSRTSSHATKLGARMGTVQTAKKSKSKSKKKGVEGEEESLAATLKMLMSIEREVTDIFVLEI